MQLEKTPVTPTRHNHNDNDTRGYVKKWKVTMTILS